MDRKQIDTSALFLSGIISIAWTIFLFIATLQMRSPGFRRLGEMLIAFAVLLSLIFWLVRHFKPVFNEIGSQQRMAMILFSCIFAGLLLIMIPVPLDKFFYALSPAHELKISVQNGNINQVELLQFNTAAGPLNPADVSYSPQGTLSWIGKVGDQAVLAFKPGEQSLLVKVDWDGNTQTVDLSSQAKRNVIFVKQVFAVSWPQTGLWMIAVWTALASAVFVGTILLVSAAWRPVKGRMHWYLFAIPMIVTWSVYLLTFWPGLMSPDSVMQWDEVQSGQFTDAHPAVHTMFIWLLSRLWNTPAVLVIFHILLLSLLMAWGLGELQKRQVSPAALWLGAVLITLFPISAFMVVSVWKDITYACALFVLFLQYLKIVLSNGKWLENNWNLAGLVLAGLAASFVRHNGLPVALGSLAVLMFAYQKTRRRLLVSIIILLLTWIGIRGPFYSLSGVKLYPGFGNILFLDHINAHLHAGTPLMPAEISFLESLLPLSDWPYNCADSDIRKMDGPIPFDYFSKPTVEPARLALRLFFRAPVVDIVHTLCASSLVWKINTGQYLSIVPLGQDKDGTYNWVSENNLGVVEKSIFPGLVPLLSGLISDKSLFSKPAFYLLTAIFVFTTLSLRQPRSKLPLISTPLIIQTGTMLVVNFAQDFRYLFSSVLIALFSLLMLFIPRNIDP